MLGLGAKRVAVLLDSAGGCVVDIGVRKEPNRAVGRVNGVMLGELDEPQSVYVSPHVVCSIRSAT
jgi:hypothetical protein